ncbi:MAG: hypothetical protein JWN90_399 [Parcubacteria group bacterium]|nr:hypothetical protein [Parcubacteria group bacterium]
MVGAHAAMLRLERVRQLPCLFLAGIQLDQLDRKSLAIFEYHHGGGTLWRPAYRLAERRVLREVKDSRVFGVSGPFPDNTVTFAQQSMKDDYLVTCFGDGLFF